MFKIRVNLRHENNAVNPCFVRLSALYVCASDVLSPPGYANCRSSNQEQKPFLGAEFVSKKE